ncbi:MAG TPA: hypothetical protein VMR33_15340 [Candidatus Baltobacteraceae bacterium]|nr:hypothetical protein [Candidatus Baltobacteraceae bacterium]
MRFAFACMILTVIACLLELLGITYKTLTIFRSNLVPQIAMILAPLLVAMTVYRRARCAIERERQGTGPAPSKTE